MQQVRKTVNNSSAAQRYAQLRPAGVPAGGLGTITGRAVVAGGIHPDQVSQSHFEGKAQFKSKRD